MRSKPLSIIAQFSQKLFTKAILEKKSSMHFFSDFFCTKRIKPGNFRKRNKCSNTWLCILPIAHSSSPAEDSLWAALKITVAFFICFLRRLGLFYDDQKLFTSFSVFKNQQDFTILEIILSRGTLIKAI